MDQIKEQDPNTDSVHNCTDLHAHHQPQPHHETVEYQQSIRAGHQTASPQPVNMPESMGQIGKHGTKSEPVLNSDGLHTAFNRGTFLTSPHQSRLKA